MCDFLNPKNVTIGSGINQNKKLPTLWPIGQKMLILHDNLEFFTARDKLPSKKGNFWSTLEPMVTFFGLKNYTSP